MYLTLCIWLVQYIKHADLKMQGTENIKIFFRSSTVPTFWNKGKSLTPTWITAPRGRESILKDILSMKELQYSEQRIAMDEITLN